MAKIDSDVLNFHSRQLTLVVDENFFQAKLQTLASKNTVNKKQLDTINWVELAGRIDHKISSKPNEFGKQFKKRFVKTLASVFVQELERFPNTYFQGKNKKEKEKLRRQLTLKLHLAMGNERWQNSKRRKDTIPTLGAFLAGLVFFKNTTELVEAEQAYLLAYCQTVWSIKHEDESKKTHNPAPKSKPPTVDDLICLGCYFNTEHMVFKFLDKGIDEPQTRAVLLALTRIRGSLSYGVDEIREAISTWGTAFIIFRAGLELAPTSWQRWEQGLDLTEKFGKRNEF